MTKKSSKENQAFLDKIKTITVGTGAKPDSSKKPQLLGFLMRYPVPMPPEKPKSDEVSLSA